MLVMVFLTDSRRSTLAAGTGLDAPKPTLTGLSGIGRVGWFSDVQADLIIQALALGNNNNSWAEFQLIEFDRLGQELGSALLTFGLDPAEFLPSLPARKRANEHQPHSAAHHHLRHPGTRRAFRRRGGR